MHNIFKYLVFCFFFFVLICCIYVECNAPCICVLLSLLMHVSHGCSCGYFIFWYALPPMLACWVVCTLFLV